MADPEIVMSSLCREIIEDGIRSFLDGEHELMQ